MAGGTQPITFVAYSGTNFAPGAAHDVSGRLPDMIDPVDAPIYKALKWKQAISTRPTWQTDSLAAVTGSTFRVSYVDEPSFSTTLARSESSNVIEKFYASYNVTDIDQAIAANGGIDSISDLAAYELEKQWKRLTIGFEKILASQQALQVDSATGDANCGRMAGLFAGITTNMTTLTGADTTISEADLIAKADAMVTAGASMKLDLFATLAVISQFARSFTGRPTARTTAPSSQAQIDNFVSSYLCPSNAIIKYNPDRSFIENNGVLLLDMAHLWARGLYAPSVIKVIEGSGTPHRKGFIKAAWTVDWDNEKRHAGWLGTACPLNA